VGIAPDSKTDLKTCKFGLAMSGGGYRATLFHLGALRRLNEIGWLKRIDRITSVSGGSLLLGFLLSKHPEIFDKSAPQVSQNEWRDLVSKNVHKFVRNDLRTVQTLKNFSINWFSNREKRLDSVFKRLSTLYGEESLANFPYTANGNWPEIYILATDIVHGQAFRFSNNTKQSGHRKLKLCDLSFFPLYLACATSACFPPVFGPVSLSRELSRHAPEQFSDDLRQVFSGIMLMDGGLYDNLGINLIIGSRKSFVRLFSEAGNPYKPSKKGIGSSFVVKRYMELLADFVTRLNVQRVHTIKKNDFAFWGAQYPASSSSNNKLGYSKELVENYLRFIRTDLDRFTDSEAKIIENHGYAQAELSLAGEFNGKYKKLNLPEPKWPHPEPAYTNEKIIQPLIIKAEKRKKLKALLELDLIT